MIFSFEHVLSDSSYKYHASSISLFYFSINGNGVNGKGFRGGEVLSRIAHDIVDRVPYPTNKGLFSYINLVFG